MGLIKETNAQYYTGEQQYYGTGTAQQIVAWPLSMTPLIFNSSTTTNNFKIFKQDGTTEIPSSDYGVKSDPQTQVQSIILLNVVIPTNQIFYVRLNSQSVWDNYGSYSYISLKDIVNNFMVSYVGMDKLIPRCRKSDIIFHAKRGLQEFSYDTLKSVNQQELTIPNSLSLPLPQDYVNYVQLSWVDGFGVKHPIYPTRLTSNPTQPLIQDESGEPAQDSYGENLESAQSITNERWKNVNTEDITGEISMQSYNANVYNWTWWDAAWGQRYGLLPEDTNINGWFTIDEREGKFSFSSDLVNQLIIIEYISDGLAYDMDSRVPKMAEDALYTHIAYSMLATRANIPEYIINRYKKDRRAKLRNAKIRLSNLKSTQFTQVMRGKSKWIKH
tara:strand:- start:19396 stop:20556 length:1161 start_codon:yes stop_codon:yes gene_type:complete